MSSDADESNALYGIWGFALLAWILIFAVAVILMIGGKSDIASGMLAGWAVGFLLLATTCFANLNSGAITFNDTTSPPPAVAATRT